MPYHLRYVRGAKKPWKIVRNRDNVVVGSSETKPKAKASIRARMSHEKRGAASILFPRKRTRR